MLEFNIDPLMCHFQVYGRKQKIINLFTKCLSISLLVTVFSCGKTHRISDTDLAEQPYHVGDTLIFMSSTNLVDSIFIDEIERFKSPSDPLDLFPDYTETVHISAHISLLEPYVSSINKMVQHEYMSFLSLRGSENSAYFDFELNKPRDTLRYRDFMVPIDSIRGKGMNEVIEINSNIYESIFPFPYDLERIFWSRKYGFVKYEFSNGLSWQLIAFIRRGENILLN